MEKLKGDLLELYEHIKHGDDEHKQWLYDEMLKFQKEQNQKKLMSGILETSKYISDKSENLTFGKFIVPPCDNLSENTMAEKILVNNKYVISDAGFKIFVPPTTPKEKPKERMSLEGGVNMYMSVESIQNGKFLNRYKNENNRHVIFDGDGGYPTESEFAKTVLTLGKSYKIENLEIGATTSNVFVICDDGKTRGFNTCLFYNE